MNLRLPSLTAQDLSGRVDQLHRYLCTLVEALNLEAGAIQALPASQPPARTPTPEETFSSIKSLIIKSADIVERYGEKISRSLEGKYLAQSEFGAYTEETSQRMEETSTALTRAFASLQSIQSELAGIESTLVGVNAYLRSGLLYYGQEGIPVYGLEVGQQTQVEGQTVFNKYARFTSGKLSFYDANDNEVAYISDYKLFITNAQVTATTRQGHFQDITQPDGSVVTKYIAG